MGKAIYGCGKSLNVACQIPWNMPFMGWIPFFWYFSESAFDFKGPSTHFHGFLELKFIAKKEKEEERRKAE